MLLSNCAVCGKKKAIFIKNKEVNSISNDKFRMNKIIIKDVAKKTISDNIL